MKKASIAGWQELFGDTFFFFFLLTLWPHQVRLRVLSDEANACSLYYRTDFLNRLVTRRSGRVMFEPDQYTMDGPQVKDLRFVKTLTENGTLQSCFTASPSFRTPSKNHS